MNTSPLPYPNILVIAANGKTGRRVASRLEARGVNVRRGSRSSSPAFDWASRDTWPDTLEGMDAAYVVYQPDLAVPNAPDDIRAFTRIAREQGVRKLVLLSGRGVREALVAERIVAESGLEWTNLRAAWFSQNFTEGDFSPMIRSGVIALPMGIAVEPIIDAEDIADVAAVALTDPGLNGRSLDLSGPEALTHHEIAAELARAAGRAIRYEPISDEAFRASLLELGTPSEYIDLLTYLFKLTRSGVNTTPTSDVESVLGRPPRSFADFATIAATAGAFEPGEVTHG